MTKEMKKFLDKWISLIHEEIENLSNLNKVS